MSFVFGFFRPGDHDCSSAVEDIATGLYEICAQRVLKTAQHAGLNLNESDYRLDAQDLPGSACWTPELGATLELVRDAGPFVESALAQLALCNAKFGKNQSVSLKISPSLGLLFAGFPLPRAETLQIESDQSQVKIVVGEQHYRFLRRGSRLELMDCPTVLRRYVGELDIVVTGGNCLDMAFCAAEDIALPADLFSDAVDNVGAAFDLVSQVAPEYTSWTRQLIRQIHVLGERLGSLSQLGGRSAQKRPGQIVTTAPRHLSLQAETLIHESSHQHFYMLQLLSPVAKNTGEEQFFTSPLNGMKREITRYLLAYHVVANMMAFHKRSLETGKGDREIIEGRLTYLRPIAREYITNLTANSDLLTEQGNAFWLPSRSAVLEICEGV